MIIIIYILDKLDTELQKYMFILDKNVFTKFMLVISVNFCGQSLNDRLNLAHFVVNRT